MYDISCSNYFPVVKAALWFQWVYILHERPRAKKLTSIHCYWYMVSDRAASAPRIIGKYRLVSHTQLFSISYEGTVSPANPWQTSPTTVVMFHNFHLLCVYHCHYIYCGIAHKILWNTTGTRALYPPPPNKQELSKGATTVQAVKIIVSCIVLGTCHNITLICPSTGLHTTHVWPQIAIWVVF